MRRVVGLVALVLLPRVANGQGMIFQWVDARGNLHATDRLGDVPEPYYGMYLAEVKRLEAERQSRAEGPAAASPSLPPAAPTPQSPLPASGLPAAETSLPSGGASRSLVDAELDRRATWQRLVAAERQELAAATAALAALEAERAVVAQNPLLVHTPPVAAELAQLDARRTVLLERLEKARRALLTELPARARRENVPPKWLQ